MGDLDNCQCSQGWVLARSVLGYGRCRSGLELLGWPLKGRTDAFCPTKCCPEQKAEMSMSSWGCPGAGNQGQVGCCTVHPEEL